MAPPKKPDKKPAPRKQRKPSASIIRNGLTADELRFIDAYIAGDRCNGGKAAIEAGFSEKGAAVAAHKILKRPHVKDEIDRRMKEISKATNITAERVLQETFNILTADVNDLVEYRRTCCRHCYGIEFGYQRTVSEYNADFREWKAKVASNKRKKPSEQKDIGEFDEQGGIGYHALKDPNPDCLECFGVGIGNAHFKDTRRLSANARSLYAGVKVGKEGTQMLLLDKAAAAEKLFKHFGLYKADNGQKNEGLAEMIKLIQAKKSKLPIKG